MRTVGEAPGAEEAEMICTPAVLPCSADLALVMVRFSISAAFTCEMPPVTSLFFCTP